MANFISSLQLHCDINTIINSINVYFEQNGLDMCINIMDGYNDYISDVLDEGRITLKDISRMASDGGFNSTDTYFLYDGENEIIMSDDNLNDLIDFQIC